MAQHREENDGAPWSGLAVEPITKDGGKLWVGKHSVDEDLLVFDPSEEDRFADHLSFYSLTQHRKRTFPRAVVLQKIQPLSDELGIARAQRDYARRDELLAAHQAAQEALRSERAERQRLGILDAHQRYLEGLGITDGGAKDTPAAFRPGRVSRCHACGVSLDNFADAVCTVCNAMLCSCGACACGGPRRRKSVSGPETTESQEG